MKREASQIKRTRGTDPKPLDKKSKSEAGRSASSTLPSSLLLPQIFIFDADLTTILFDQTASLLIPDSKPLQSVIPREHHGSHLLSCAGKTIQQLLEPHEDLLISKLLPKELATHPGLQELSSLTCSSVAKLGLEELQHKLGDDALFVEFISAIRKTFVAEFSLDCLESVQILFADHMAILIQWLIKHHQVGFVTAGYYTETFFHLLMQYGYGCDHEDAQRIFVINADIKSDPGYIKFAKEKFKDFWKKLTQQNPLAKEIFDKETVYENDFLGSKGLQFRYLLSKDDKLVKDPNPTFLDDQPAECKLFRDEFPLATVYRACADPFPDKPVEDVLCLTGRKERLLKYTFLYNLAKQSGLHTAAEQRLDETDLLDELDKTLIKQYRESVLFELPERINGCSLEALAAVAPEPSVFSAADFTSPLQTDEQLSSSVEDEKSAEPNDAKTFH